MGVWFTPRRRRLLVCIVRVLIRPLSLKSLTAEIGPDCTKSRSGSENYSGNFSLVLVITLRFLRNTPTSNCPQVELTLGKRTMRGLNVLPPINFLP
jgi:hypothetical protein